VSLEIGYQYVRIVKAKRSDVAVVNSYAKLMIGIHSIKQRAKLPRSTATAFVRMKKGIMVYL
jgi:hypothetical protein